MENDVGAQGLIHQMGVDGVHLVVYCNKEGALPSGAALLQFILKLCLYGDGDFILQRGVNAFACLGQHKETVGAAVQKLMHKGQGMI